MSAREWKCQAPGCTNGGIQTTQARLRKWCSEECRKKQYTERQPCVDCGAATCYGPLNGYHPEPRCPACAARERKVWPRERIIEAIQEWVKEFGEPPAMPDWSGTAATNIHDDERAKRAFELVRSGRVPHVLTAVREFGSWSAAVEAAGFERRAPNGGGGNQLRRRSSKAAA